jgi:hypothetical protein
MRLIYLNLAITKTWLVALLLDTNTHAYVFVVYYLDDGGL